LLGGEDGIEASDAWKGLFQSSGLGLGVFVGVLSVLVVLSTFLGVLCFLTKLRHSEDSGDVYPDGTPTYNKRVLYMFVYIISNL
jgi:hypothetical protein